MSAQEQRKKLLQVLAGRFKGRIHADSLGRRLFSTDASIYMVEPLLAAVPRDEEDLVTAFRACQELGIGLHPRGGATGLAGESLGPGLVLDCHPAFRRIDRIDPDHRRVRVGCGVTLSELNRAVALHGLKFGPDPSSGTRATIGGMIGTNATGTHSLDYGYTGDHLIQARVLTSAGEIVTLQPGDLESLPGGWKEAARICRERQEIIENGYPQQHRNRCGYNLRVWQDEQVNPLRLLAGAEGTLGLLLDATLDLSPVYGHTGLALFCFDSVRDACEAVKPLMRHRPSGLELIDYHILAMGRRFDPIIDELLPEHTQAVLLGEWSGENEDDVRARMAAPLREMRASDSAASDVREAHNAKDAARLWLIRREAEALIMNRPGRTHAISFIEDAALPHERLIELFDITERVLDEHGLEWATFGHAGPGELHTKVYIDLHEPADYARLVQAADTFYSAVIAAGGSISGEHGDGLARSPFIQRQYPELFETMGQVKQAIDPHNTFNPGRKTVSFKEHPALSHTRLSGRSAWAATRPELRFDEGEFEKSSEACHGCGACRNVGPELSMCPLFRVTHDELASPRAKGNVARLTLFGPETASARMSKTAKAVAEYCFNCKLCRVQCPSHVDIPKLILELKAEHAREHGLSLGQRLLAASDSFMQVAGYLPGLDHALQHSTLLREVTERLTGLDRSAPMPHLERGSFYQKATALRQPQSKRRLLYFADSMVLYSDHQLGLDFIRLANAFGWEVIPYTFGGSGLPALDVGDLPRVRSIVQQHLANLAPYVARSLPIVCSEPSAALMIKEEWPLVTQNPLAKQVSELVREATDFLAEQIDELPTPLPLKERSLRLAHHAPCHLQALGLNRPVKRLIENIPKAELIPVDQGCCGIAGTYGILKENRARSLQIGAELFTELATGNYDRVLCECSTCRMQIQSAVANAIVQHPLQFLAQSLT